MSHKTTPTSTPQVKIVYSKIMVNGRLELVPLKRFADGSLHPNQ